MARSGKRRIGIVGFGELGDFLSSTLLKDQAVQKEYELAFVWNRSKEALEGQIPMDLQLENLEDFETRKPDLIVEVAHPCITRNMGVRFLRYCDYLAGSPTAFAEPEIYSALVDSCQSPHGLYIPRGALPGLEEVLRMQAAGNLMEAHISMKKHPRSIHFLKELTPPLSQTSQERILYQGPLRELCALAPNNVNTMAVLALSSGLGFDKVRATLIANPELEHHITELHLFGPENEGARYRLSLIRESPAGAGAVTSTATLKTFLTSMLTARDAGSGLHFR